MARPMNRRAVIKGILAGTTGVTIASLPTPAASSPTRRPGLSPLLFHSPPVEPFRDPLLRPSVCSGTDITIDATAGPHRFHSELGPSPAFGYGGQSYGGPVIEATSGVATTLRFRNRLGEHVFAKDVDTSLHGVTEADRHSPRSVLHLHGGVTPPRFDGHPQATIMPGQDFVHTFPNRQEAAGLWYHDHAMGITRLNVQAGLASMYVIRDRGDTGRADNPLRLPSGEFEVPLLLQEKIFTADGAQSVRSTPIVPEGKWEGGAVGDVGVVNGTVWPEMEVARGLYRFRLINAGSFSVWNLHFSNGMRFWVIGNDGGLLDAPVPTTAVRVSPAERVDLLVDFDALAPGDTVRLCNDESVPGQAAILGERTMPFFCRFRATTAAGFRGSVPQTLRGGVGQPPRLPPIPGPERVRNLTISQPSDLRFPPSIMTLNNLHFTSTDIEMPRQGSVEQWNLINTTPDPHPIHLHLVTFRVLGRQPVDVGAYALRHPHSSHRHEVEPLGGTVRPWPVGAGRTVGVGLEGHRSRRRQHDHPDHRPLPDRQRAGFRPGRSIPRNRPREICPAGLRVALPSPRPRGPRHDAELSDRRTMNARRL